MPDKFTMPDKLVLWHCECGKWVLMSGATAPACNLSPHHVAHSPSKVHFEVTQVPIESYYQQ
jgi:hypothetical protein